MKRYCYVNYDDINQAYPDLTVLIAKPTEDMLIEAPEPMYVSIRFEHIRYELYLQLQLEFIFLFKIYNNSAVKQKYQLNLKSNSYPIDVYLASNEENNKKSREALLGIKMVIMIIKSILTFFLNSYFL